MYDKVAKSHVARQQLLRCGEESLDIKEEMLEDLFKSTRHVIYDGTKSTTMAEAHTAKWRMMKEKSFIRLPPDADSLRQHCFRDNYLAYLIRHPSLSLNNWTWLETDG